MCGGVRMSVHIIIIIYGLDIHIMAMLNPKIYTNYYEGVWCQTAAFPVLVTIMITTGVIDEDTDSPIILADVTLFITY